VVTKAATLVEMKVLPRTMLEWRMVLTKLTALDLMVPEVIRLVFSLSLW
jgi:hypothetical protein